MNHKEIERLSINQPFLKYDEKKNKITGKLLISMYYDLLTKNAVLYDVSDYLDRKETILDQYEVEINLSGEINIPETREIGGRLKKLSEKLGINLEDLHVSINGTCCLMPISQTYYNFLHNRGLIYYFENEIYPYFYSQSYFEKYGMWPLGEFPHGRQGSLEYFNSLDIETKNETIASISYAMQEGVLKKIISNNYLINGETICTCGCGNKLLNCKILTTKDKYLIIELFQYLSNVKMNYPYLLYDLIEISKQVLKVGQPKIARF